MKDFKEVVMTETAITVVMTTSKGEITLRLFDKEDDYLTKIYLKSNHLLYYSSMICFDKDIL